MNARALLTWVGIPLVIVFLLMGPRITRHIGPYELGAHDLVVEAQSGRGGDGPKIGNCPVFPKDNVWNTAVDKLPRDPKTDTYIESIGATKPLHPDFGSNLNSGLPFTEIPT